MIVDGTSELGRDPAGRAQDAHADRAAERDREAEANAENAPEPTRRGFTGRGAERQGGRDYTRTHELHAPGNHRCEGLAARPRLRQLRRRRLGAGVLRHGRDRGAGRTRCSTARGTPGSTCSTPPMPTAAGAASSSSAAGSRPRAAAVRDQLVAELESVQSDRPRDPTSAACRASMSCARSTPA